MVEMDRVGSGPVSDSGIQQDTTICCLVRGSPVPQEQRLMGCPIRNYEICYSKYRIPLEKSILDTFYQNLPHMWQKMFSTDSITLEPLAISFRRVN